MDSRYPGLRTQQAVAVWVAGVAGCLLSPLAGAAEPQSAGAVVFDGGIDLDSMLQVSGALLIVIVSIVILSIVARKLRLVSGGTSGQMQIIDGISLGGKDRLLLVRVGGEHLVIGVSPGSITKIHRLYNYEEPAGAVSEEPAGKGNFSSLLTALSARKSS